MPFVLPSGLERQIDQAVSILIKGGVVAFPTDTVYGLGASVADEKAVGRIYTLKGRPRSMALPILVADAMQIESVARDIPQAAWRLVEEFLPGALTLVLYKNASVPDIITAGGDTVAVRIPDYPVPLSLIRGLGAPIVGTSANVSGHPSALSAADVRSQFGEGVDMIIDGGECGGGVESTIVDLSGETPSILREGAISTDEIRRVLGHVIHRRG